ncbi:hypothetical protein BS47DRAFT_1390003 [Hydnum rufescens UP504]|uniref:MCM C-terminal AAA(+) ATPase domain-containing protein n=1 Tax=Hydnum rufescens UP504 TaxID=1448309 RepID=A0A9P6B4F4_9AGAM|nr:hypothetical protein BS47DRAFT_1390003 [Hydnum rufescens UP504]
MDDKPDGIGGEQSQLEAERAVEKGRNQQLVNDVPPLKDATGEAVIFRRCCFAASPGGDGDPTMEDGDRFYIHETLARAITDQYYRSLPYHCYAVSNLVRIHTPDSINLNSTTNASNSAGLIALRIPYRFPSSPPRLFQLGPSYSFHRQAHFFLSPEQSLVRPRSVPNRSMTPLSAEIVMPLVNEVEQQFNLDGTLRGDLVERAKAGDKRVFTGTFTVVPDVSHLGLPGVNSEMQGEAARTGADGRDLQYKTSILACMVQDADARNTGINVRADETNDGQEDQQSFISTLADPEIDELRMMVHSDYIYDRLVGSISPIVYAKFFQLAIAIRLFLATKSSGKGCYFSLLVVCTSKPRGERTTMAISIFVISISVSSAIPAPAATLICGDLDYRYICAFLPRAVYTSGEASFAAGLTAAVANDEETGEFTIEAGALMLADNAICAIHDFDQNGLIRSGRHPRGDGTANDLYRQSRNSCHAQCMHVGMSAPTMCRFALFFVVLNECHEQVDENIARYIVNVHRFQNLAVNPEFSTAVLQRYIRYARTFNPKISPLNGGVPNGGGNQDDEFDLVLDDLSPADLAALNEAEASFMQESIGSTFTNGGESMNAVVGSPSRQRTSSAMPPGHCGGAPAFESSTPMPAEPPKRKLKISCEKTGAHDEQGSDRDDLIDWYLQHKENEINDVEELEYEKELISKVLNKLVKVDRYPQWGFIFFALAAWNTPCALASQDNLLLAMQGDVQNSLPSEDSMQMDGQQTHYMVHPSVDADRSSAPM